MTESYKLISSEHVIKTFFNNGPYKQLYITTVDDKFPYQMVYNKLSILETESLASIIGLVPPF